MSDAPQDFFNKSTQHSGISDFCEAKISQDIDGVVKAPTKNAPQPDPKAVNAGIQKTAA